VGRMSVPRKERRGRPRYLPAITRMALYLRLFAAAIISASIPEPIYLTM
jgi:hypothetical protein